MNVHPQQVKEHLLYISTIQRTLLSTTSSGYGIVRVLIRAETRPAIEYFLSKGGFTANAEREKREKERQQGAVGLSHLVMHNSTISDVTITGNDHFHNRKIVKYNQTASPPTRSPSKYALIAACFSPSKYPASNPH